jgi:hypothetical protein
MGDDVGFRLSRPAQEIADALTSVLSASVVLYDVPQRTHHLAMREGRWISHRNAAFDEPRLCSLQARINDRWMLYVCSRRPLHPDAGSIAGWAAAKLALHLPRRADDEPTYPPVGGDGGSGGAAEIGIPVWWARKARN